MVARRNIFTALAVSFAAFVGACSSDKDEDPAVRSGPKAACEHINDMCQGVEGYQSQDCSDIDDQYAKLNATDKADADAVVPCVLSADTCDDVLTCVRPTSAREDEDGRSQSSSREHDTEDACEHINSVCADTEGFETQDCSRSNSDYETLSASDKKLADSIVPCIMDAEACETAFECLKLE